MELTEQPKQIVSEYHGPGEHINKPVVLQLQYSGLSKEYQVISITSTVIYKPGQWLTIADVDKCCQQKGWSVTMVHDDAIGNMLLSMLRLPAIAIPLPTLPVP
jgi:hypothetical protein